MCGYALPISYLGRQQHCMQQQCMPNGLWLRVATHRYIAMTASHMMRTHDVILLAQGMSISRLPDGAVVYEGSMQSRRKRLRVSFSIAALRSLWWLGSTAICLWRNVISVCSGTDSYARHPA